MVAPPAAGSGRALLVVAHPGHELRVFGWLHAVRPLVFVLTDGSGSRGRGRIERTTALLAAAGARPGSCYAPRTDRDLYRAILCGDPRPLVEVVDATVAAVLEDDLSCVAADALEGFNPSHDLCRYAVNVAVALLRRRHGRRVENLSFALDGPPVEARDAPSGSVVRRVSGAELDAKVAAALAYDELQTDVAGLLERHGRDLASLEALVPARVDEGVLRLAEEPPYYEAVGVSRVGAGLYAEVIRYREHVRPLVHAVWRRYGLEPGDPA